MNIEVYNEQKKAVLNMIKYGFIDVKTGQGKSLIAAIAAILLSKKNSKIYIVSVNDYLSERDSVNYNKLYDFFKLTVSYNKSINQIDSIEDKDYIYKSRIMYTSSNSLIFDYLRKITVETSYDLALDTVIVDEADFVLIDNANSEFSLSDSDVIVEFDLNKYKIAKEIFKFLDGAILDSKINQNIDYDELDSDYIFNMSENSCYLTIKGINKIEKIFNIKDLTNQMALYNAILHTLEANVLLVKDRDYIVSNNRIVLIDKNNGRLLHNSQKEKGIHAALELKENLEVSISTKNVESLTYQVFFNLFNCLFGLSGTLLEASEEIQDIYSKSVIKIKPHQKNIRIDLPDIFYKNKEDKKKGVLNFIKDNENDIRPILIICESDIESKIYFEAISNVSIKKIQLLNSYNYESSEFEILNKAGNDNCITIATFLCSRGTDIKIDDSLDRKGGLTVISLAHYENMRIDNQIRGRSGRIGQNGSSKFYCSIDDDIFASLPLDDKNKLLILDDKEFFSEKTQNLLSKKSLQIQKNNYSRDRRKRFELYLVDSFLTSSKNKMRNLFCNFNSQKDIELFFNDFCKKAIGNIDSSNCDVEFFGYAVPNSFSKENILFELNNKLREKLEFLSEDIAIKSLVELSKITLREVYSEFKDSIKHTAMSYDFGNNNSMFNYNKFVLVYKDMEQDFNDYFIYLVFLKFLSLVKCESQS